MAGPARALLSSPLAGVCRAKVAASCGRRTYSAAAAVARKDPVVGAAGKERLPGAGAGAKPREEGFWMRDPKTGCWMPENRLHDVDAADLRARLLFSKKD